MTNIIKVVKQWIPVAIVITLLSGMIYAMEQYNFRSSANDPQIQMARDVADAFASGAQPQALDQATKSDIATSLAPYLIAYDDKGKAIASSGLLDGTIPTPPAGVFEVARAQGENRITWQPKPGVRSAIVLVRYEGKQPGFVLVGRSLSQIEERTSRLVWMVTLGWVVTMIASLAAVALFL